jgi:anti-sigma B factor antagonist
MEEFVVELPTRIRVRDTPNAMILDVDGALRLGKSEAAFRENVERFLRSGKPNLLVNMAGVPAIDSAGLGALIRAFTSVKKAGGNCKFYALTNHVLQVLKMVRVDLVLDLAEDEASALRAC